MAATHNIMPLHEPRAALPAPPARW